jgi:hypothetical protein
VVQQTSEKSIRCDEEEALIGIRESK